MNKSVGQLIAGKKEEIKETWIDFLTEYWEMALAGLSVLAAVFGFLVMQRKKRLLTNYRKEITNVYMVNRTDPKKCLDELKEIRQRMETDMHDEKLTENHYLILREKLKDYISEMKEKEKKRKKKEKKKRMKEMRKALVPVETKAIEEKKETEKRPKKAAPVKDGKDYHAILGVASDATEKEIKSAHKKLAEKYHPDKVRHLGKEIIEVAAKNMRELNEDRDILMERLKSGEAPEPEEEEAEQLSGAEEKESLPQQDLIDEGKLLGTGEVEDGEVEEKSETEDGEDAEETVDVSDSEGIPEQKENEEEEGAVDIETLPGMSEEEILSTEDLIEEEKELIKNEDDELEELLNSTTEALDE